MHQNVIPQRLWMTYSKELHINRTHLWFKKAEQLHSLRQQFIPLGVHRAFEREFSDALHNVLLDPVPRAD